jgi:diaminohydroxyphosphoribosylaminopyrimidine deaminase / 5-amino-6-(5-phosphoribosylamino)uracil reductase
LSSPASDLDHMRHALRLAARGLGRVAPNPAVGCVVVSVDGRIAGRGWTGRGGRPHAETVALAQAGAAARGGTAYVTLEPCAHYGKTPPCAKALVEAGVSRVVVAADDPDPRVSGKGYAVLEAAGIKVARGVCAAEARALNAGFLKRVERGLPLVALKIAQSADGFVADAKGNSRWITAERAREHGHLLRAQHDAILIGIGTALADDPMLTCRLPGLEDCSPVRVVLDSRLKLNPDSQLVRSARKTPLVVFTASSERPRGLVSAGVTVVTVGADSGGHADIAAIIRALGEMGLTRLLVEGGPKVHAACLSHGLVDVVYIYRAPILLGEGARSSIAPLFPGDLKSSPRLVSFGCEALGPDLLESFAVSG